MSIDIVGALSEGGVQQRTPAPVSGVIDTGVVRLEPGGEPSGAIDIVGELGPPRQEMKKPSWTEVPKAIGKELIAPEVFKQFDLSEMNPLKMIAQTGLGLAVGLTGFADKALSQTLAFYYGLSEEAVKKIFKGKHKVEWSSLFDAVQHVGEERESWYQYQPTDPGARLALNMLASVPFGIKTFFHTIADLVDSPWQQATLRTSGDMAELGAFASVFQGIVEGVTRPPVSKILPPTMNIRGRKITGDAFRAMEKFEKASERAKFQDSVAAEIGEVKIHDVATKKVPKANEKLLAKLQELREARPENKRIVETALEPQPLSILAAKEKLLQNRDAILREVEKKLTPEEFDTLRKASRESVNKFVDMLAEPETLGKLQRNVPYLITRKPEVEQARGPVDLRGYVEKGPLPDATAQLQGVSPERVGRMLADRETVGRPVSELQPKETLKTRMDEVGGKSREMELLRREEELEATLGRVEPPGPVGDVLPPPLEGKGALAEALKTLKKEGKEAPKGTSPKAVRTELEVAKAAEKAFSEKIHLKYWGAWGDVVGEASTYKPTPGAPPGTVGGLWSKVWEGLKSRMTPEEMAEFRRVRERVENAYKTVGETPGVTVEPPGLYTEALTSREYGRPGTKKGPINVVEELRTTMDEILSRRPKLREEEETTMGTLSEFNIGELPEIVIPDGPPGPIIRVAVGSDVPGFGTIAEMVQGKGGNVWVRSKDGKLKKLDTVMELAKVAQAKDAPGVTLDFLGTQTMFDRFMKRWNVRREHKQKWYEEAMREFESTQPKPRGQVVKHRDRKVSKSVTLKRPPVFVQWLETAMNAPKLEYEFLRGVETPTWTFEKLGPAMKDLFYWSIKDTEFLGSLERRATELWTKRLFSGVDKASRENITIYAISQQKVGLDALKVQGITKIPKLTPIETQIYDTLRLKFEDYYKRLNAARVAAGERPFKKVDNYFTFVHVVNRMTRLGKDVSRTSPDIFAKMYATAFRFAKPRAVKRPKLDLELDSAAVFRKYYPTAIRHIHSSPTIATLREVLGTFHKDFYVVTDSATFKPIKAFLKEREANLYAKQFGQGVYVNKTNSWKFSDTHPYTYGVVDKWLNTVVGQPHPLDMIDPTVTLGLQWLNRSLTFYYLAMKFRSAAIQPTAIANTFIKLGLRATGYGIASIFHPGLREFAQKHSRVIIDRKYEVHAEDIIGGFSSLTRAAIKGEYKTVLGQVPGRVGKGTEFAGRVLLKPLQFFDMETAIATWNAGFWAARNIEGKSVYDAIKFADDCVVKSQISAARSDISPVQRSQLGRAFTLFQTFTIGDFNFFLNEVIGYKNPNIGKAHVMKHLIRYIVARTLINILYEDVIGIPSPFPTPIRAAREALEKGGSKLKALLMASRETTEIMPFLASLRFGSHPFGALAEVAGEVGKLASDYPIKPPWYETVGKVARVPGGGEIMQIKKILEKGGTLPEAIMGKYPEKPPTRLRTKGTKSLKGTKK